MEAFVELSLAIRRANRLGSLYNSHSKVLGFPSAIIKALILHTRFLGTGGVVCDCGIILARSRHLGRFAAFALIIVASLLCTLPRRFIHLLGTFMTNILHLTLQTASSRYTDTISFKF